MTSLLSGCGNQGGALLESPLGGSGKGSQNGGPIAMGRYVETEVPLPDGGYSQDMVMLEDGRLRVAMSLDSGETAIYTSGVNETDWEQTMVLPVEVPEGGWIESLSLSPKGDIFCSLVLPLDEEGTAFEFHFYVVDPAGAVREIPITYPDIDSASGYLLGGSDFTDSGKLVANFKVAELMEIDLETGALSENSNDLGFTLVGVSCGGEDCYLMGFDGGVGVYRGGETQEVTGVLGKQINESLQATAGMGTKVALWQNADGYLFFTTHEGLFSYIPGGSITEELVSGARSSLGDPSFRPEALTGSAEGTFYVLGSYGGGVGTLYRYDYDPDVPTVPGTNLRIYSLYDDENLRQMISQYQKSHPEVAIDLEIGMTGEDGITEADAIRTLNTEILAGSGPDIIELDGFNLDTFLGKDLLMDLSGVLPQAGPVLNQVTDCFASGGKLCALPTTFVLPAIYGPGHILAQIQDLDTLVAACTQAREEDPERQSVLSGFHPAAMADQFYDSCSAAWVLPDGSLDGDKLADFYEAMGQLYALDESYQQMIADMLAEYGEEMIDYTPGDYTGMGGAMMVLLGTQTLTPGTLEGMEQWASVLAGDDQLEGYETAQLNLQANNVFLPRRIMGVLASSAYQEAAEAFIAYMLSDEVQANTLSNGFPVNRTTFDREIAEDRTSPMSFSTSGMDGEMLSLNAMYPDARRRQELKTWVDNLTTPALTNRIIRGMVMDQMTPCLEGEITPQEAAQKALQSLNLYLAE